MTSKDKSIPDLRDYLDQHEIIRRFLTEVQAIGYDMIGVIASDWKDYSDNPFFLFKTGAIGKLHSVETRVIQLQDGYRVSVDALVTETEWDIKYHRNPDRLLGEHEILPYIKQALKEIEYQSKG